MMAESNINDSQGPLHKKARLSSGSNSSSSAEKDIPSSSHYHISYAHRAVVTCICYSIKHDIILTGSQDGVVKFWKRTPVSSNALQMGNEGFQSNKNGNDDTTGQCLEFIKSYMAHTEPILALVSSLPDGDNAASVGEDNVIKFYDVGGFDVTGMIQVKSQYPCGTSAAFITEDQSLLAVSSSSVSNTDMKAGTIYIFSSLTLASVPVKEIKLHAAPLTSMRYNYQYHCMISADEVRTYYRNFDLLSILS